MPRSIILLTVLASAACAESTPAPTSPAPSPPATTAEPSQAPEPSEPPSTPPASAEADEPGLLATADRDDGEAAPPVDASRCHAAFNHMTDVSTREIERLPPEEKKMALEMAAKASAKDAERREKFVAQCAAGGIDVDCIMGAEDTMSYIACFKATK